MRSFNHYSNFFLAQFAFILAIPVPVFASDYVHCNALLDGARVAAFSESLSPERVAQLTVEVEQLLRQKPVLDTFGVGGLLKKYMEAFSLPASGISLSQSIERLTASQHLVDLGAADFSFIGALSRLKKTDLLHYTGFSPLQLGQMYRTLQGTHSFAVSLRELKRFKNALFYPATRLVNLSYSEIRLIKGKLGPADLVIDYDGELMHTLNLSRSILNLSRLMRSGAEFYLRSPFQKVQMPNGARLFIPEFLEATGLFKIVGKDPNATSNPFRSAALLIRTSAAPLRLNLKILILKGVDLRNPLHVPAIVWEYQGR